MYEPEVNDYVEWTTKLGQVHKGWVYFKAEPVIPKRGWVTPHRYIHVLLCCYESQWQELKFVKKRKDRYE